MDRNYQSQAAKLAESLDAVTRQLRNGCGNHGCVINPPKGVGTNAICRCRKEAIIRNVEFILDAFNRNRLT